MTKLEAELIVILLALILGWLVGGWIGLIGAVAVLGYLAAASW